MREKKRGKSKSTGTHRPTPPGEGLSRDLAQYVTTKQAAEMLGVAAEHINHLIYSGRVRAMKMGRDWLVFRPSVEQYYRTKSPKGKPTSRPPKLARQK